MSRRATKSLSQRSWPPVGGTFHFENLIVPPLTKTCPKMVLSHKGGSLCVKDVFAKKFLVPGEMLRCICPVLAQSGLSVMPACLSAFGAKRTCIGVCVRALLNFSIALGSRRRADPRPLLATLAP